MVAGASFSKYILLFTVANLPRYRLDTLDEEQAQEISSHRLLTIFSDIVCMGLVLGFILYWKIAWVRVCNDYTSRCLEPHKFCLRVKNIEGCNEEQLRRHFESFGKVAQISCIYTHRNLMIELRKIVKLVFRLKLYKPDELKYE